jgi:hypothetical protein
MFYKLKVIAGIFILGLFTNCLNYSDKKIDNITVFYQLFCYIDNFLKECESAIILKDSSAVQYLLEDFERLEKGINSKNNILNKEFIKKPIIEIHTIKEFNVKNHFLKVYHIQLSGVKYYNNEFQNSIYDIVSPPKDYKIVKIDGNNFHVLQGDLLQILKGIFVSINNIKEAELFVKTLLIINYGVDLKLYESYETYSLSEVLQKFVSSVLNLDNDNKIPNEDSMILEKLRLKQMKNYYLIEYRLSKRNPDSTKKDLVIYCKEKLLRDASLLSIKSSIKGKIIIE